MGVLIDSRDGFLRSITGRTTLLLPGVACLRCRNLIPGDRLAAEQIRHRNPQEHERLRQEGYAPELAEADPAVITFTTAVAARAVMEFLDILVGFMVETDGAHETLEYFDRREARTNARQSREPACFCVDRGKWGRGDTRDFLGLMW